MTERQVQRAIWIGGRSGYRLMLPNYTPQHWFECDMFGVSRSGYFHEFEIKLTVSDFKADCKKLQREWNPQPDGKWISSECAKHDLVASRSVKGPTLFWYVVPQGMISVDDVPEWAGLCFVIERQGHVWMQSASKPAPRLHNTKVDQAIVSHALGVCYFRYWRERDRADAVVRSQKRSLYVRDVTVQP